MTAPRSATRSPGLLRRDVADEQLVFVAGEGVELLTSTGERIIDAISGVGVTCLGYDVPRIVERMHSQAALLPYVHSLRFESEPLRDLAAKVGELTPPGLNHAFFVSGGSEAMESALKLTRQYWLEAGRPEKWRVIGRWPSFHGNTLATLSAGWHYERRRRHRPLLLDFCHIEAPNSYRGCGHCRDGGGCTLACAFELERTLIREGPESIAAFVAEPLVGAAGGAFVPHHDYFGAIREICDRHDVLFIADEVITGFGRTGRWFGIEHWNVEPDVIVFAKGVSAGFAPLGGMAVRDELVDTFRCGSGRFEHNFTMAGHPVACAAGVAALEELVELRAPELVARHEPLFFGALEPLRGSGIVGDLRGKGLLAGIELVMDLERKTPFPSEFHVADRVANRALDECLLVYPCTGSADGAGDHILLMPAFTTPPELFSEIARRLGRALESVAGELAR